MKINTQVNKKTVALLSIFFILVILAIFIFDTRINNSRIINDKQSQCRSECSQAWTNCFVGCDKKYGGYVKTEEDYKLCNYQCETSRDTCLNQCDKI